MRRSGGSREVQNGDTRSLDDLTVLIKGGGEMATGVAHRLTRARFKVCMTETPYPQAVRRGVAFCEAVYEGEKEVEGVVAKAIGSKEEIFKVWQDNKIPILVDPEAMIRSFLNPDVLIDAILAKKNLGTKISDASLVIGLGPGFRAGGDVHLVIETNRGHNLGRVILQGGAEENTGVPGEIGGSSAERVFRAPASGRFSCRKKIGDYVQAGEVVASVGGLPVQAEIEGILRGLLRDGSEVWEGMKLGDVDPRGVKESCYTISDKARAVAGGVLEAIMMHLNS